MASGGPIFDDQVGLFSIDKDTGERYGAVASELDHARGRSNRVRRAGLGAKATQSETRSLSLSPKVASNRAILSAWGLGQTQSETPGLLLSMQQAPSFDQNPTQTTISYTYDSLYRLTDAVYSNGFEFHYTYDPVGNRLTQTTCALGVPCSTTAYNYDAANRLIAVNGVAYTWDDNGNLLNDGTSTYAYDSQNRLISLTQGSHTYGYAYNGTGDRLTQSADGTVTRYTLDLEAGLTQVLSDGSYAYLYGVDRLAQVSASETDYFLGDALGSVRQLVDATGQVILAKNYEPFGTVLGSAGSSASAYGFAGELQQDNLVYLRARSYSSPQGRFISRVSWTHEQEPMSFNSWLYVENNSINRTDPSGNCWVFPGNNPDADPKWYPDTDDRCRMVTPRYATGATEAQLGAVQENQGLSNDCGKFAAAAAMNILLRNRYVFSAQSFADYAHWRPFARNVPVVDATTPEQQAAIINDVAIANKLAISAEAQKASVSELRAWLDDPNKVLEITLAWDNAHRPVFHRAAPPGSTDNQSANRQPGVPSIAGVIRLPIDSGHAVVLGAYDPNHYEQDGTHTPWGVASSWDAGGKMFWLTDADFRSAYNYALNVGPVQVGSNNVVVVTRNP
jgi:RHS repeat-associated protein